MIFDHRETTLPQVLPSPGSRAIIRAMLYGEPRHAWFHNGTGPNCESLCHRFRFTFYEYDSDPSSPKVALCDLHSDRRALEYFDTPAAALKSINSRGGACIFCQRWPQLIADPICLIY